MSFFEGFVGHFDQSLLRRVIFCQNLTNPLLAEVKIACQGGIQLHYRHPAVHVRRGLADAFITLSGGGSHGLTICRLRADVISRSWFEIGSRTARE